MNFTDEGIQLLTGFCGSIGFGVLFNVRGRKLLLASFGGIFSWGLYLLFHFFLPDEAVCYFFVSLITACYAEILARICKAPACTFCIVSLIPLVPGSALYYATAYALSGDAGLFLDKALYTIRLTVALSLGIVLVTAFFRHLPHLRKGEH